LIQLVKNVPHLVQRQRVIRFHGRVTGSSRRNPAQRLLNTLPRVQPVEIVGKRPNCGLATNKTQQGRDGSHAHIVSAERLDLEAEPLQRFGMRSQRLPLIGR
jgi:hypothetical protein